MSHLARVIAYRDHLTSLGVTCAMEQAAFCEEGYIRALVANHVKYHDDFSINENEQDALLDQLDKWNSVAPIRGRLILEAAKLRLARVRQGLIRDGVAPGNTEFAVQGEVETMVEGQPVPQKICVTSNHHFTALVNYLQEELRAGHE